MGMPDLVRTWTREAVLALPDDRNRYELVDGALLVTPSPRGRHQRGVLELYRLVDRYVRLHRLGRVALAPADLDLGAGQLLQPDLFVGRMREGRPPVEWDEFAIPILVAEILSPSTARYDRTIKRRRYQTSGVGTYWIVDLDAQVVEVWTPVDDRPSLADQRLIWRSADSTPPLDVDLPGYFGEVWDE